MTIDFMFTPFCARPCTTAMLLLATNGRYNASAPEFLIPSTAGPTSVLPKSIVVFVYTALSPVCGTAYFCSDSAADVDDGETPYASTATFFAPIAFISL